jgi:hypothetical protein
VNIDGHLALAGIAGDSTVASKPVDGVARALIFSELDLTGGVPVRTLRA